MHMKEIESSDWTEMAVVQ